ncbi:MAG: sigma-70 family RNA polymerase sigma factor [Bacillota bacterium]|nr:sigma-70 family RNA polymerase sigma factor [Bacillota bacterium]
MFNILFTKKDAAEKGHTVNDLIRIIQDGNKEQKEKFINDYKPFIIKTVSKTLGRYVEIENSEEYSIGLSAFNESIDCFDEEKNRNFFNFSEQVIRRKLYTHLNLRKKELNTLPFSYLEETDVNFENRYLSDNYNQALHQIEIKDQYTLFEQRLSEFGICFEDLVLQRPKHKDSLKQSIKIAKLITEDVDLYKKLLTKKTIPMTDLLKKIKVNHKAIENNRKFIISVCLILGEEFEDIREHINEYVVSI